MMDMSLALGIPLEILARTMSEKEFRRWLKYRKKNALPTDRLELYLAQVCQLIATTMGGAKDSKLSDYLIEFKSEETVPDDAVVDIEEVRKAFGYSPRKKRK